MYTDIETLKEVRSRIVSATIFIKAKQTVSSSFANIKVEPATTHIQQQRKFFSTKKKKKNCKDAKTNIGGERKDLLCFRDTFYAI